MIDTLVIGAAIVIILVLTVIATYMQFQVNKMKRKREVVQAQLQQEAMEARNKIVNSINILARGVLADQVTLTEASIRINGLLDQLGVEGELRENYIVFTQLAKATAHIPILKEWKKLPTKKKLAFDAEREKLEEQYRDFILDAAKRIQNEIF